MAKDLPKPKKPVRSNSFVIPLATVSRSEEHTSELQSQSNLVCRLLLENKTHLGLTLQNPALSARPPALVGGTRDHRGRRTEYHARVAGTGHPGFAGRRPAAARRATPDC